MKKGIAHFLFCEANPGVTVLMWFDNGLVQLGLVENADIDTLISKEQE